jgi:hypothetical protein
LNGRYLRFEASTPPTRYVSCRRGAVGHGGQVHVQNSQPANLAVAPGQEIGAEPDIEIHGVYDDLRFERGDAPVYDPVERRIESFRQEGRRSIAGVEIGDRRDRATQEGVAFSEEAEIRDGAEFAGRRRQFGAPSAPG